MFIDEARIAMHLHHRNIVQVFDVAAADVESDHLAALTSVAVVVVGQAVSLAAAGETDGHSFAPAARTPWICELA